MRKLIEWLYGNHIAIVFSLIVLCIVSVFIYFDLPKDVFPDAAFPRFQVIADIGFASLENTEINVTRPLEDALKTVPEVSEVRSVTERGTSTIDVFLNWGADLNQAYQFMQNKISETSGKLPANTGINITRMTTSAYPMSEYGIWSDKLDLKELYVTVKYNLLPLLIGIEGIYGLEVIGGEEPEIWVRLDPNKLIQYNLNAAEINSAIDDANKISFIGNVSAGKKVFFALGGELLQNIKSIGEIVIATRMGRPIFLKDVAVIKDFHADVRRIVSINGHKGLFIDVLKQQTADGLKVSRELDDRMAEIEKQFRGKLHISKWDLSDFVRSSIQGILFDIFIGIVIILVIVYYIMNRFRYSLPIMLVIPLVIIFEFLVIKLLGLTINIMTLGGLSAAIGIIADNAIVITENYIRFRSDGVKDPLTASMSSIVSITIWATLVSIIVFIPLNILSGIPGLFFRPLAITLASTIVISLIMAILVMPIFIKYFIERRDDPLTEDKERSLFRISKKGYLIILNTALKYRRSVVIIVILLCISGTLLFLKLPDGFLPEWDEGQFVFDYIAPVGSSIEGTDEMINEVEKIIKQQPEVKSYIRKTGTHLGTPFAPPTRGEIVITLNKDRKRSTFEMIDYFRTETEKKLPELETDFFQMLPDRLDDLTGGAKPIVVNVIGNDLDKLYSTAHIIQAKLEKVPGLDSVLVELSPKQKEIKVIPRQSAISLLGLSSNDVSRYAQMALYGETVSSLQKGLQSVPIRLFYEGDYRNSISSIEKIPIYTQNGGVLSLGKLATFKSVEQHPEIQHKNGSIVVSVIAEISGRALGDVVKDIKQILTTVKSDDFSVELAGNYKNQQVSFRELMFVLFISLILIMVILLFIFESYKTAIAVFLGTLASATFVIFGIFISGIEFDVSSFTGMITVMGIVVNNGILVIYFVERFRNEGKTTIESILSAGNLRFRPVLITNLAAIAGFLPMALNLGHGGEVLRPFSLAMISGLVGSMFFSLLVMPVFYLLIHKE